jgi:hypothetical protein
MIRMLTGGLHKLSSKDPVCPGCVSIDIPATGQAYVSFRKDCVITIWLFGDGQFNVIAPSGVVSIHAHGIDLVVHARGRVKADKAKVEGYVAVTVEARGGSQVEVFDDACKIIAHDSSSGTLHRRCTGEFFDQSTVRALESSRAIVHGENGFARVREESSSAKVSFSRD